MESILVKNQVKKFTTKIPMGGKQMDLVVEVRWDDCCRNGHNSLGVTGTVYDRSAKRRRDQDIMGGCIHDVILAADGISQEVKDLIPFHLCSSDAPLHYKANVLYHLSEKDCWGKLKGEPKGWDTYAVIGNSPIKHKLQGRMLKLVKRLLEIGEQECYIVKVEYEKRPGDTYNFSPKYTILIGSEEAPRWHECPFDLVAEAEQWRDACLDGLVKLEQVVTSWGEGKERDLEAARSCAVGCWPEGYELALTDEQLLSDELPAILDARLPILLEEMRRRIEAVGLVW